VVTAKFGKKIEGDRFLAEKGEIGIQRVVLGPGTYRMNPFGYDVELVNQTVIPAGHVGVLVNNQKGGVIKERVLQPGTHYINPRMYKVKIVSVGLNEYSLSSEQIVRITDAQLRGEIEPSAIDSTGNHATGGAIIFPSSDGFTVGLDVTLLWELSPENAVNAVNTFGQVSDLVERVINPKLDSACRNEGSNYTAKEMVQGDTRAKFQDSFTDKLTEYASQAPLEVIAALPRRVYVPVKIQLPIMQAQLKKEEMLTNKEIELTSKVEAKLEEQKKLVEQEIQQVKADTRVLRASIQAEAEKEIGEFEASTRLMVSKIELETQKVDAQIATIMSEADAATVEFKGKKEAELYKSNVNAFGTPESYNSYIFAIEALPVEKLPVKIIHSGEGTLWTDIKGAGASSVNMKLMQQLRSSIKEKSGQN
jgi:hypothetical protein